MTDTDRMLAWLRETLDAAEETANAACWDEQSDVWTARPPQASYERYTVVDYLDDGVVAVTPENADADGVGQHIALHDPHNVRRRIAADRKTVDDCEDAIIGWTYEETKELARDTIRNLAEGWGWTEEERR